MLCLKRIHFIHIILPMTLNINGDFPKQQESDDFVMESQRVYSEVGYYVLCKNVGDFPLGRPCHGTKRYWMVPKRGGPVSNLGYSISDWSGQIGTGTDFSPNQSISPLSKIPLTIQTRINKFDVILTVHRR